MNLLLHICCAPCTVYTYKFLKEKGYEIKGYYFNPNIHPLKEFKKRKENVLKLSKLYDFNIIYSDDYMEDKWKPYSNEDKTRCLMCYDIRLEGSAKKAKEEGFDCFSTTLLISPYQDKEEIIRCGNKYAKKYNIKFVYYDYSIGYRKSIRRAKEMGIYTQRYCGCIISYNNSKYKDKINWD